MTKPTREQLRQAMMLYRTASPYYICVAMVMMDNRLKGLTR